MLCKENALTKILYRFYDGYAYIFLCVLVSAIGVIFDYELVAAAVLIFLLSGQFFVLSDTGKMFYPVLFMVVTLMNVTGSDIALGAWLIAGAIPVFGGMIYNIVKQKKRISKNKSIFSILAVSIAVSVGGIGSISSAEYFELGNMYYVVFLGFGMLLLCTFLYVLWEGEDNEKLRAEFTDALCYSGIFLAFVMLLYYLLNLSEFTKTLQIVEVLAHNPFRNVAVSYYLLTMPFAFYKSRQNAAYLLGGIFIYAACLISGSRMGLLFGSVEFLVCMVYFIIIVKKRKWLYATAFLLMLAAVVAMREELLYFYLGREEFDYGFINLGESRFEMFRRSVPDFLSNPVFGRGLGYTGNEDCYMPGSFEMNWYHNFICQIVGSLGIVGILAYSYQFYVRLGLILEKPSPFGWLVCLMYMGAFLSSITDTGIFTPFPTVFLLNCAFLILGKADTKPRDAVELA